MTEGSEASDGILGAGKGVVDWGLQTVVDGLGAFLDPIVGWIVGLMLKTPYPVPQNGVLGSPVEGDPFFEMYQVYETGIQPGAFLLLFFIMGVVMFTNIWKRNPRKRITAFRRVIFAFPALLMWWPVAGWYLRLIQGFTDYIIQIGGGYNNIASQMLFGDLSGVAGGLIGAGILYVAGISMVLVDVAIYGLRWVALKLYLPGMAFLIVIAVVPIKPFSAWAFKFMRYFVTLSLIPIPVAFLITMVQYVDLGTLQSIGAPQGGPVAAIGGGLFEALTTTLILAMVVVIPIAMFPASGRVSSAVATGAMAGRFATAGAASGSSGSGSSGSSTSASSSGMTHGDGESGDEGGYGGIIGGGGITDSNTFAHPRASKAKRKRERAKKLGSGARKAGGKTAGGVAGAAKSAAGHTYKNYKKDGSTAKGLASDARSGVESRAQSVKSGMSERAAKVREAKDRGIEQFQDEWGPSDSSSSTLMQTGFSGETRPFSDDTLSGGLAYTESPSESSSSTSSESTSGEESDLQFIETGSVSSDQTFDRNQSGREVGGFGDD